MELRSAFKTLDEENKHHWLTKTKQVKDDFRKMFIIVASQSEHTYNGNYKVLIRRRRS